MRTSMAGSLLDGLSFDDDAVPAELASLDLATLEAFVRRKWKYSRTETDTSPAMDFQPQEPQIMRALCFFNACRLAAGIGVPRSSAIKAAKDADASKDAYRSQKMALLQEQAPSSSIVSAFLCIFYILFT